MTWVYEHSGLEPLDPGILRILRIFKEAGIVTCQCPGWTLCKCVLEKVEPVEHRRGER